MVSDSYSASGKVTQKLLQEFAFAPAAPEFDVTSLEGLDYAFVGLICPSVSAPKVEGWALVSRSRTF
jgi:hypothetical protein